MSLYDLRMSAPVQRRNAERDDAFEPHDREIFHDDPPLWVLMIGLALTGLGIVASIAAVLAAMWIGVRALL